MTLPTTQVIGRVMDSLGQVVEAATVTARLSEPETYLDEIVPRATETRTGPDGSFSLSLWPNTLGTLGSWYHFRITTPTGQRIRVDAVVSEDGPVQLAEIGRVNRSCGCGPRPPLFTLEIAASLGWYADVDSDGLYLSVDASGLYAQVETATLTSKPYPVEAVEEITLGAVIVSGSLISIPIESLDLGAVFTAGDLRALLKTTSAEAESLDVGAVMVSGDLRTLLKTASQDESLDFGAILVSGSMTEVGRVFVTMPAEEMSLSAAFIAGELV